MLRPERRCEMAGVENTFSTCRWLNLRMQVQQVHYTTLGRASGSIRLDMGIRQLLLFSRKGKFCLELVGFPREQVIVLKEYV